MLDPEIKRTIRARVDAALDRLDADEAPPEGIAAALLEEDAGAPTPDLYALLAQMTALTREVQLQGRAANRLSSEVKELVQQVSASTEGPVSARVSAARRDAQVDLLGEILDIRDRFSRGREEAQKRLDSFRGFFSRLGSRPIVDALLRGNTLAMERLDETLGRYGVHEIQCSGGAFDPNTMRAVERDVRHDVEPGLVTEVLRRGYRTAERILRYADVRISSVGQGADAGEKRS